jgi:2-keto-4-pentenoate hydratase/2-oxohepta-3-ene-1,7-dioic acid hydratase in catechol pathway
MTPPQFLKEGDVVTIDIERIGQLTNPVRANLSSEPA